MPQDNTTISSVPTSLYEAARARSGVARRADRGRIVVSGGDRASYLQGLLTNDIVALKAGDGCYAAYLTAQGRMITDVSVYELGDVILLSLGRDVTSAVLARLDQLVFSEDVQLGDVSDAFDSVIVVGPKAVAAVAGAMSLDAHRLGALGRFGNIRTTFDGDQAVLLGTGEFGVPGFEILAGREHAAALLASLEQNGTVDVGEETLDVLRIESGVPKFHQDMDEETIPLEAGLEASAISFTKGCYVGQEVIIRVMHRGHGRVARRLVGLTTPSPITPGAVVEADGRPIGRVTSAAFSPARREHVALGYVQRDFVEPGTQVVAAGSPATVTTLPFVAPH